MPVGCSPNAKPEPVQPAAAEGSGYHGWRVVGALAVTQTVGWGVLYYGFAVLAGPMADDLGGSPAALSGAYSLMLAMTGLAAVPVARWLDRHGAHLLMTTGSVGAVLVVVAWSQVTTLWQLYLVLAGVGVVSAAVLYEPAFAVVVRWFAQRRSSALLVLTMVAGFASTIFLPLTNALVERYGWRQALLLLAVLLAVTTVVPHAVVLRQSPPARPDRPAVRGLRAASHRALRDPVFRWYTLAFAAHTFAVVVVVVHLVPYLREQGHPAAFAAVATGALGALSVVGRMVLVGVGRRWSIATVTAAAFLGQGAGLVLLLAAGGSRAGVAGFVLLFGLGFGVATIARPDLLAGSYGVGDYATLAALLGLALTVAKTAGPVAAGVAVTVTGSYAPVLAALAVSSVAAAVALLGAVRAGAEASDAAPTAPAVPVVEAPATPAAQ